MGVTVASLGEVTLGRGIAAAVVAPEVDVAEDASVPLLDRALAELTTKAVALGWVRDLLVAGSVASGDYRPGVSDVDLVAIVDGEMTPARVASVVRLHERLDAGVAAGLALGCVYVDEGRAADPSMLHPTWTHARLVQRILSGVTRAELLQFGRTLYGRPPTDVLAPMTPDDVRAAARSELRGYWAWAARRPWMWTSPVHADLGLTSMARGRLAIEHGRLASKTEALDHLAAPAWLAAQVRARRDGEKVVSPRLRTAWVAWRDAALTTLRA